MTYNLPANFLSLSEIPHFKAGSFPWRQGEFMSFETWSYFFLLLVGVKGDEKEMLFAHCKSIAEEIKIGKFSVSSSAMETVSSA